MAIPIIALKRFLVTCAVIAGFHFSAQGLMLGETAVQEQVSRAVEAGALRVVRALGYREAIPLMSKAQAQAAATEAAIEAGLNPAIVLGNMHVESEEAQFVVSPKGAIGFMQVMPSAENLKLCKLQQAAELFDGRKNIRCGTRILLQAHIARNWNTKEALQEYNGGSKCVGRCRESVNHSSKVIAFASKGGKS